MHYEVSNYIKLLKSKRRVICGFKENKFGEAVVTTGIPREFNPGVITYTHKHTESYEDYMLRKALKRKWNID